MSMIGNFRALSPRLLEALRQNPANIHAVLGIPTEFSDNEEPAIPQELLEAGFSDGDVCEILDIQKAWHGVYFLLCGRATPEGDTPRSQVIMGGREVGEDVGYGPARFLEPREVKEIAAVLGSISPDDLPANFDPETMNDAEIYPFGWGRDEALQWLLDAYVQVRNYYKLAAEKGFAMILYLT
jgi:hypothetical protein